MNLRAFLVVAIASFFVAEAKVKWINHDQVQSFTQPEPTTESQKSAVKYKPQLRISNGCRPYPAVQADGSVGAGLRWSGPENGKCKGSGLGSQVYSRSDWYQGKWAIMYAWYFPKAPEYKHDFKTGHRHYWVNVVVFVDSPNPNNSTLLGVSTYTSPRYAATIPVDEKFVVDRKTIKFNSYKHERQWYHRKHNFQYVGLTEASGETQSLITWEQLTAEARSALSEANYHVDGAPSPVVVPMKDSEFVKNLKDAAYAF